MAIETTKISFEELGAKAIKTTGTDGKGVKPNKGKTHEGKLVPIEHVITLTAGDPTCKTRKCERKVVHDGECAPCHARTIERQNQRTQREAEKAEGRRVKEMDPKERDAYHDRRLRRIKDFAIKNSDESFARLRGSETIAAAALQINYASAEGDARRKMLDEFDLKAAKKLGLGDD